MRVVNAAYAVLSDPARRAAYDARRYLPRTQLIRHNVAYQTQPVPVSRPRSVVARPATNLQRGVDRFVGVLGVLLLVAIGFYVVNVIPMVEQEARSARSGVVARRAPAAAAVEHPTGIVPDRVRTDDGLRTFPNAVLVAPAHLEPFADLPVVRVDANARGLARYAVYYGDWSAGGINITGLIGRSSFDSSVPQIAGCAPEATYCVGNAPGQTSGPPGLEVFRADDLVEDYPAFATHRVCCNGVFWSLSWYEERANMSYTIDLSRTQAAAFGNGIDQQNVVAARELGTLARQLVRLP
jgi:hypothetical protein